MGAGTTAKVARELNRNYLGSEINSEYYEIIKERLKDDRKNSTLLWFTHKII